MPIPNPPTTPTNIPIQNVNPQMSFNYVSQSVDLDNGNMFLNDGTSLIHFYNGGTGAATVTVWGVPDEAARTGTSATGAIPNASIGYQTVVPTGKVQIFGPYRQAWFNQTSGNIGYVYLGVANTGTTKPSIGIINY